MGHFQASRVRTAWFLLNLVLLPLIIRELFLLLHIGFPEFGNNVVAGDRADWSTGRGVASGRLLF